jgi:4-hydroxybenzoate polyprenyltransferase
MYLNDAFDREIDARERPDRPIPSGQISSAAVFVLGFGMLATGLGLVSWCASVLVPESWLFASAAGFGLMAAIIAYDLFHKNNPLSPLLMGSCRVLVYVTAALAVSGTLGPALLIAALGLLCHLIGLTYAAKQETLTRLRSVWPLVFLAVTPAYGILLFFRHWLIGLFALALWLWILRCLPFLLDPKRRSIPDAVVRLIAGIALIDALWIASVGAFQLALVAVALAGLTRVFQRYIPGT